MLYKRNPQLNRNGELIHLLSTEGLSRDILTHILDTASQFVSVNDREVKKVPLLRGKSVFNLFFENSTRTRTTFEIAAKRLSADVFNLDIARSSASKGESLLDTIANLSAMAADIFVVRHSESGAPYLIAEHVAPHVHVINAGDGRHAHPTQGLLDAYTIRHFKHWAAPRCVWSVLKPWCPAICRNSVSRCFTTSKRAYATVMSSSLCVCKTNA